jgi:PTH1 family peptidyl-tRNA hydrolase
VKLIVGLGNPGARYRATRHNVGFAVVDEIARRRGVDFESAPAEALLARVRDVGPGALLVKPLTFMNLSGHAVRDVAHYFRIELADILVVADDAALPLGRIRARARGSDGGHNGLRSIVEQLGTQAYARLRVGIGRGDSRRDLADHVLAQFEADERGLVEEAVGRAADASELFVTDGVEKVMNLYNRWETPANDEGPEERARKGTGGTNAS